MSDTMIRTATVADAERCVAVLTLAFGSDPPCRWTWPDPHQYLEAFPRFARAFGSSALELGTALCGEVFLASPCGCRRVSRRMRHPWCRSFRRRSPLHSRTPCLPSSNKWRPFIRGKPIGISPLIGVEPAHQGQGIGAALLRHVLSACDTQSLGLPGSDKRAQHALIRTARL